MNQNEILKLQAAALILCCRTLLLYQRLHFIFKLDQICTYFGLKASEQLLDISYHVILKFKIVIGGFTNGGSEVQNPLVQNCDHLPNMSSNNNINNKFLSIQKLCANRKCF